MTLIRHEDMPAYVLAGGQSRRFGSDKARATLDGTPLIVRVATTLRAVCSEVLAVADVSDKYVDLGLPTIADRRPGLGPLAGVDSALLDRLERFGPGWVIVVSCDLAGLKAEWVAAIKSRRSEQPAARAVAFHDAFWQPFPGAYHTDLLPVVSGLLDDGEASFQRLLSDDRVKAVALPLPADWPAVPQVNTPEELKTFVLEPPRSQERQEGEKLSDRSNFSPPSL